MGATISHRRISNVPISIQETTIGLPTIMDANRFNNHFHINHFYINTDNEVVGQNTRISNAVVGAGLLQSGTDVFKYVQPRNRQDTRGSLQTTQYQPRRSFIRPYKSNHSSISIHATRMGPTCARMSQNARNDQIQQM